MSIIGLIAAVVFIGGYILIALENKIGLHKTAIAMLMGCVLWFLAGIAFWQQPEMVQAAFAVTGAEIFNVIALLLGAMMLVEILVHYGLFDALRAKLLLLNVNDKQQFLLIMLITFFMTALLDTVAVAIAMIQIARRFFKGRNLLIAAAAIIVATSAGGAWSPLGNVTTILLWLADKFTVTEVIQYAFLPSFAMFATTIGLLYKKLNTKDFLEREVVLEIDKPALSERLVVWSALISFSLPLAMGSVGLPPYVGMLFGLAVTWVIIEIAKIRGHRKYRTHETANMEKIIKTVDLSAILFVIGTLLSVAALLAIGVLDYLSGLLLGGSPSEMTIIILNIFIGAVASVMSDSTLVALAIDIIPSHNPMVWALLSVMSGAGSAIFVIGSAAGVIVSGMTKNLTFVKYMQIATLPVICGFIASVIVWFMQYYLWR